MGGGGPLRKYMVRWRGVGQLSELIVGAVDRPEHTHIADYL